MENYTNEQKLKAVYYYLECKSYEKTRKKFNITYWGTIEIWVKKYEKHGLEGLMKNNTKKDGKFKQNVVEYMRENKLTLRETMYHFNLGSMSTIIRWQKIYDEKGPEALYVEEGEVPNMRRKTEKAKTETEELKEKVEMLEMENEYLKKLNALVQERIKQEKKKK